MHQIVQSLWNFTAQAVSFFLRILYKILGKELPDEVCAAFLQFVKFSIVGVSNTVVSYVLYAASLFVFKQLGIFKTAGYMAAQVISFALSVLWSYYWNSRAVFVTEDGKQRCVWKTLLKTYITYSFTGLFLSTVLLYLWIGVFHVSEFIAPLLNIPVSVPINFIINKCWAFKEK